MTFTSKIPIPRKIIALKTTEEEEKEEEQKEEEEQNENSSTSSVEIVQEIYTKPHITKDAIENILRNVNHSMNIKNVEYYQRALTHKSILRYVRKYPKLVCPYMLESNERLELVGDAVLGLVVADYLFREFPNEMEGTLTVYRTRIVKGTTLAHFAKRIGLAGNLLMSERTNKMNGQENDHLLENAFEAFIGALYYDRGFPIVREFILNILNKYLKKDFLQQEDNFKDKLLKLSQVHSLCLGSPKYQLINEQGKPNEKIFTVVVYLGETRYGKGRSKKKKQAEQLAAQSAIKRINERLNVVNERLNDKTNVLP